MPTYVYECRSCNHKFEVRQSMSDAPISECPACQKNEVRRIIGSAGIIFKGSGFYVTDKNAPAPATTCPNAGCQGGVCQGSNT